MDPTSFISSMMSRSLPSGERGYVAMMFDSCNLFASWDPRNVIELGDYGKLNDDDQFTREGNIFEDGLAQALGITLRQSADAGVMFIKSHTLSEKQDGRSKTPGIPDDFDGLKKCFKVSGSRGALLAMVKPEIHRLSSIQQLSYLLYNEPTWKDRVVVTESYICPSFARLCVSKQERPFNLGLYSSESTDSAFAKDDLEWRTTANVGEGEFLQQGFTKDSQTRNYPLFRLVGRRDFLQSGPYTRLKRHSSSRRKFSPSPERRISSPPPQLPPSILDSIESPPVTPLPNSIHPSLEVTQEDIAAQASIADRDTSSPQPDIERVHSAPSPGPSTVDEDANTQNPPLSQKHRSKSKLGLNIVFDTTTNLVTRLAESVRSRTFSDAASPRSPRP
ncbi:hypothetical protein BKA93DRAFT_825620 [Sparassis latifolia]|uniref:Uncharacterized protein n=1 Tax=Sparassis crispa TaxID=139825 RepID=A0A401H6E7_9APHY|nr:predicted protein [Sparassis crispa]GBE89943.1 predicted protein [Sparassis crispa]